jgi:NADH-quinone oxidoreductase subunit E
MADTATASALTNPLANPETLRVIDQIITDNKEIPGATMVVLNELQNQIGFISEPMQSYVARKLGVGTACYVGGAPQLIEKAKQLLGVEPGQTTKDGNITLEICRCVGACSQAPVVVVDETANGRVKPNKFPVLIRPLSEKEG